MNSIKRGMIIQFGEEKYCIYDVIKKDEVDYLVMMSFKQPKETKVYRYEYINEDLMISEISDEHIICDILFMSLKNKELL